MTSKLLTPEQKKSKPTAHPSPTPTSTPRLSEVARHVVVPSGIVTTGWPSVKAKAAEFGIFYDLWQNQAGSIFLGKRADGLYAATVGGIKLSIPRQVGKTFLVGTIMIIMCLLFPGLKVLWTAHHNRTITNTFRVLQGLVSRSKLKPLIKYVRLTNGEQEIAFVNKSIIMFGARESGFGVGFEEVDIEVFDEDQIMTEKALENMVAATNQAKHPFGALLFYMGTPPKPGDPSDVAIAMRRKALSGKSKDMVYLEFSADADADLDDRAQWAKANPSYPIRTPLHSMLRLRENLVTDDAWRRQALGIWDDEDEAFRPVTLAAWRATAKDVRPEGDPVFFVTMAKDMGSATISVAAKHAGVPHVEIAGDNESAGHAVGVDWVTGRLRELHERHPRAKFAAWAASEVKAWVPTLAEQYSRGDGKTMPGFELQLMSATDASAACAHLEKLASHLAFTHSPDGVYTESLVGAEVRALDGGSWVWDWRRSIGDLAPIAGATGALWALEKFTVALPGIY